MRKLLFLFLFYCFSLNGFNFSNKGASIVLNDGASKFKITNPESFDGWKQTAILNVLPENKLFLQDNSQWLTTSGGWLAPQDSFDLINDFDIPDNQTIYITSDIQIDGKKNSLMLGHQAVFLLDSGVTLTLKNLKLKNSSLNKISPYPFRVKTNDCKIVLDSVEFGLNGNVTFTKGSLFIHNDVKVTGSTELIYSSPDSSFIEPHSRLYFRSGTSFYYNQEGVSTNMNLFVMQDKTSELFFNSATLKTTDTGLRLTKGKLYLDNKVTISGYTKTPQTYSNGIIFGDSVAGSECDLNVYLNSGVRVGLYGKLWEDSLNTINFANKNSFIVLSDNNSKFKITKAESLNGWRESAIIKPLSNNSLFLTDNQEWGTTSGEWIPPQESFELINDLIIPDNQVVVLSTDSQIDGQGNSIILGMHSQLLIDGGVTVTFKNLKILNSFNTISKPVIRCMDWYSQLCLDNVELALSDDWAFRNGQFFIHNDVEITGTSNFSYRSVRPSYIAENSNLIFSPETTFEYYPSTTDNSLIRMTDGTSKLFFDGSTLQSTHTGIRLTKGSVYFDNKVTLTNGIDNIFSTTISTTNYNYGMSVRSVEFSPDDKYIAVGGSSPKSGQELQVFSLKGEVLQLIAAQNYGSAIYSVDWSPDGKYLAVGGQSPSSGDELQIYAFNGTSLTLIDSANYGIAIYSVEWSPDGKYLAIGGKIPTSSVAEEIQIYSFDGTELTFISSADSDHVYFVDWHPSGKYLAVAGYASNEIAVYTVSDGVISGLVCEVDYGTSSVFNVKWSKDGIYLAVGGSNPHTGNELQVYIFSGSSLHLLDSRDYGSSGSFINGLEWSLDGNYILLGGYAPSNPNNHEIQIYSFKDMALSTDPIFTHDYGDQSADAMVYSVGWSNSGCYIIWGGSGPYSGNEMEVFKVDYRFDTAPQLYSNGIVFGNSVTGSDYDLNTYLNSGARVELYGKLWEDSFDDGINFANKNSFIVLSDESSKFKITNADSFDGWRETAIIKPLPDNTLFLTDNQEWTTTSDGRLAPQESFNLINDLIIPDNEVVVLSTDLIIDGQGNSIILGRHAQLLIDAGITITFKNLKIKNSFNTIYQPAIQCLDWYSKLCLDNVKLALSDDFAFNNGQLFVHDDVEITGTSKFSYRSVRPSYIAENSNLIFSPQTTFEYYPSTTDNSLIKMQDETSKIFFDESTLQVTHTGIRLARGSVYFDNKVTLSNSATILSNLISTTVYPYGDSVRGLSVSPSGKYIAIGGVNPIGGDELKILEFDGANLILKDSVDFGNAINTRIASVDWGVIDNIIAVGSQDPTYPDNNEIRTYSFNGTSLTLIDSANYGTAIYSVKWSPNQKYLAVGGNNPTSGDEFQIYEVNDGYFSDNVVASLDYGSVVYAIAWSPCGNYVAIGGESPLSVNELQIYSFDGSSLSLVDSVAYGTHIFSLGWSPDGSYLALGGIAPDGGHDVFEIFPIKNGLLGTQIIPSFVGLTRCNATLWSRDGNYIMFAGYTNIAANPNVLIYSFDGSFSGSYLASINLKVGGISQVWSASWFPGNDHIVLGSSNSGSANQCEVYDVDYIFDTTPQSYSNSIIFGDSSLGSEYNLDICVLAAARVEIFGKVFYDDI